MGFCCGWCSNHPDSVKEGPLRDHVILNYLGQPWKFFIWEATTVGTVLVPAILLILLGKQLTGVVVGGMIAGGIREYKRRFGAGSLIGVSYWVLPYRPTYMPMTPPSHIREYIG